MKKKIILPVLTIVGISLILVGTSYAYWRFTYISDKTNIGKSKCLSIELTNQKNEISLTNTYPISDIEGKKLTPYSFTINNTCDTFISYDVNLEILEGTTMNSKYMAVMINNEHKELLSNLESANTVMSSSVESRKLVSGSLGIGDSVDYTLRLWMDESVTLSDDAMNKNFISKIVVTAQPSNYSPKEAGYDTLHDAILANEYQTTPEKAIEKINAKGEPDLSKTAPVSENDLSDKGLYKSIDDFGDTYYYRGKVTNNNVYFVGFYWQIVRINGDGSIRLLYNGTEKNASGDAKSIGTTQFNEQYDKPVYVGYMYGNPDGTAFDEVHTNTTSSTIKSVVDNWFEKNMLIFVDNLSTNVGFCGDRTISSSASGDGIENDVRSHFGAFGRHYLKTALYTCPNILRDLYTTVDSNIGNKSLTYPVGLITYDELVFAGLSSSIKNLNSYLYSSSSYWFMSPGYYESQTNSALEWFFLSDWQRLHYNEVNVEHGVRPVINLKPDVKISGGIGTSNDPFVVDTNN